jgi:hypothetical protein
MKAGDILIRKNENTTYKEVLLVVAESRINVEDGFDCIVVYSPYYESLKDKKRWFGKIFSKSKQFKDTWMLIPAINNH